MSWKSFRDDYLTNLFIIWHIILTGINLLSHASPLINSFRTLLWANDGWLVIIMPIAITEIYYQVMMIRNNPEFFEKVRHGIENMLLPRLFGHEFLQISFLP
ncbi:MAG: hypothetical protein WAN47_10835 [Nitrosotalea sp.]